MQKVKKKYRNVQSGQILMKGHQCERRCGHKKPKKYFKNAKSRQFSMKMRQFACKKSNKINETCKADEFQ